MDLTRTSGILPVSERLRPPPRQYYRDLVPVIQRLERPIRRPAWCRYDIVEFVPLSEALALEIAGEA